MPDRRVAADLAGLGRRRGPVGERTVLTSGLAVGGATLLAGLTAGGTLGLAACFVVAGGATAAVHAASGRLILGWFPAHLRGRAMAVRQTAQPLGVAVAALVLPRTTLPAALVFLAGSCVAAAALCGALVRDPAPQAVTADGRGGAASPYRTGVLWRIHATSALLVVPQFAVASFGLVYLTDERGWSAAGAGQLLAMAAGFGAGSRLVAGWWSDRVGSRLGPLRLLAVGTGAAMLALAGGALSGSSVATAALLAAAVVTVSSNGLSFTAAAEHAGRAWAGRALGVQNTAQNAVAAATAPALAAVIVPAGYGTAFAITVAFPLVAVGLVPSHAEPPKAHGVGPA